MIYYVNGKSDETQNYTPERLVCYTGDRASLRSSLKLCFSPSVILHKIIAC